MVIYPSGNDRACSNIVAAILLSVFTLIVALRTYVFFGQMGKVDRVKNTDESLATPMAVDVCVEPLGGAPNDSLRGALAADWWTYAGGRIPIDTAKPFRLKVQTTHLECVRFEVPGGVPPDYFGVYFGSMRLSILRLPPQVRVVEDSDSQCEQVQGFKVRVSCAEDTSHPYSVNRESLDTLSFPGPSSGCSRRYSVGGQRNWAQWVDSLGGRRGAEADDVFYFRSSQASASQFLKRDNRSSSTRDELELAINMMPDDVLHTVYINDVLRNALDYVSALIAYFGIFKVFSLFFVPTGEDVRRFRFNVPAMGLGIESKAEQQALLNNV